MRGKVLLLSQRRICDLVVCCLAYEFEDAVAAVTNARRIDADGLASLEFSRRAYKLMRFASGSPRLTRRLAPLPPNKVVLEQDFELFFPVFSHTFELYSLALIPNWRQRCHKAACFITEVWADPLPRYLLELLSEFDHIFIGSFFGFRPCLPEMERITGRPCTYLPLAADVPRFAPAALDQPRPIYVCNIGRRSAVTHKALLEYARQKQNFYYYDTVAASGSDRKQRTFRVDNPQEHRGMLAAILKRSCYYIANRGRANTPENSAGHEQISSRFYADAAAGTVMVGEEPDSEEFERQFDWPDAVTHAPFDSPDIGRVLADLDGDPARLRAIRRNNARKAALRHDWLHRIRVIFETLGLAPTEAMQARAGSARSLRGQRRNDAA